MNEDERRKMETNLIKSGFKGFNDPELVPALATLISNHEILRALLNDCSRLERGAMLEALSPHLPFEANSVEWYEERTAEKFRNYEQERKRIIAGDQEFERVAKEMATHVAIKLRCHKCTRESHEYIGETPLGAVILARQDGWVREKATNKEVCPKCPCADRSKKQRCPGCQRRHYSPSCRVLAEKKQGAPAIVGYAKKGELDISTMKVN